MQPTPRADALIGTAREALESLRRLSETRPDVRAGGGDSGAFASA